MKFSTAYHPQTDGQSERVIQILQDMLRACVMDFKGSWEDHLHLVEFSYNNSFQASIQMSPFEALYGRKCRSPVCWDDIGEQKLLGPCFPLYLQRGKTYNKKFEELNYKYSKRLQVDLLRDSGEVCR